MEEKIVAYDHALALRDLGFDEECSAWYVSKDYGLEFGKVIKSDLIKDGVLAPTYQQAFRWWEEKYKHLL
jgi:hypothetical protein